MLKLCTKVSTLYVIKISFLRNAHAITLGATFEDMWFKEIRDFITQFRRFTMLLVSPASNLVALALAQLGSSHKLAKVWMKEALHEIQGVL